MSPEDRLDLNALDNADPVRAARIGRVVDALALQGPRDMNVVFRLAGWALHPDCPEDEYHRIEDSLAFRLETSEHPMLALLTLEC